MTTVRLKWLFQITTVPKAVVLLLLLGCSHKWDNPADPDNEDPLPSEGLVAYFPFNGNAEDASGNGNNGTIRGAILTNDRFGRTNRAFYFDGSSSDIIIQDNATLRPPLLTICAWVKAITLTDWATIIMKTSSDSWIDGYGIARVEGTSNIIFFISQWDAYAAYTPVSLNNWSFIVGVFSGRQLSIYLDGKIAQQINVSSSISHSTNLLIIGRGTTSAYSSVWHGAIDDVRIFNRPLLEDEIQLLYHEGGWK